MNEAHQRRHVPSGASVTAGADGIVPDDPELVEDGQRGEEHVTHQRHQTQLPVQLPAVDVNGHEEEDDGEQQRAGHEDQTAAVDLHRRPSVHKHRLDEPRQTQTQHVEDVRAHDVGHGHVSFTCARRVTDQPHALRCVLFGHVRVSLPSRATITLTTVSGMLVPAARSVIPITVSGIPSVSPEHRQQILLRWLKDSLNNRHN